LIIGIFYLFECLNYSLSNRLFLINFKKLMNLNQIRLIQVALLIIYCAAIIQLYSNIKDSYFLYQAIARYNLRKMNECSVKVSLDSIELLSK
jgi:hypothetical protein